MLSRSSTLIALLLPVAAEAATAPDAPALDALARSEMARIEAGRGPAFEQLRAQLDGSGAELMFLDDRGRSVLYTTCDLDGADTIGTDELWPGGSAGLSLDGHRHGHAYLGIWDQGHARATHVELAGRVFDFDSAPLSDHSTHMAGVMIAAGVDPLAVGMSFDAELESFDWNDDTVEMADRAAAGMNVSNHSYGRVVGWHDADGDLVFDRWVGDVSIDPSEDYLFGFYTREARARDAIMSAAPGYLVVQAAGNDRNDTSSLAPSHTHGDGSTHTDTHPDDGAADGGFDTLIPEATAKNGLTVGAVHTIPGGWRAASDVRVAAFSGFGPTDDGRIKPDLVAPGVRIWSAVAFDAAGNPSDVDYAHSSGTSPATAAVSGTVNLLVQHYVDTHSGTEPLSSTMRALVIHTASEAGAAPGPDYQHGWGLLDAEAAADVIRSDIPWLGSRIVEAELCDGETHTYRITTAGGAPVRATLAWIDPAGEVPDAALDPRAPLLVNDLDLRLVDTARSRIYRPWVLDPTDPTLPATRGDNQLDNVERVDLPGPGEETTFEVVISHEGHLQRGRQRYSLILSHPTELEAMQSEIETVPQ